jgi:hypothetical protein
VKGWISIGHFAFEMLEVTEGAMDKLIESGMETTDWPFRFDQRQRVWPALPKGCEVFFNAEL